MQYTLHAGKIKYVKSRSEQSKPIALFLAYRPKFLTASAAPVLVGSALGYAAAHGFSLHLFILALLAIIAIHAGANIANDYFDHLSGNDWVNKNPTPFSGGSRYIQDGILSPKTVLIMSLLALASGAALGAVILLLTRSLFILILGLLGLLGGFFYTALPLRLGYRYFGELVIALLFGVFPVYGAYYLQTGSIDTLPLLPSIIVAILIFLVILINEFPDLTADAAVNKKTLIVRLGVSPCIWLYRLTLIAAFLIAVALTASRPTFYAGLLYLFTLPLALIAIKAANRKDLTTPGKFRASQITVLLHIIGSLALAAGFLISALTNQTP